MGVEGPTGEAPALGGLQGLGAGHPAVVVDGDVDPADDAEAVTGPAAVGAGLLVVCPWGRHRGKGTLGGLGHDAAGSLGRWTARRPNANG
jgi:hypothetical protein